MKKIILAGIACALMVSVGAAMAECTAQCTAASPPVPRFVDNGNGTISDACTGLMWEKKAPPGTGGLHDVNLKYLWSQNDGKYSPNGSVFTVFLYGLNAERESPVGPTFISGCFAQHCDWRLPEYTELLGIVDESTCVVANRFNGSPCIDPKFGPTQPYPFGERGVTAYWSGTTTDSRDITANVDFFNGGLVGGGKTFIPDYVRAVRCSR